MIKGKIMPLNWSSTFRKHASGFKYVNFSLLHIHIHTKTRDIFLMCKNLKNTSSLLLVKSKISECYVFDFDFLMDPKKEISKSSFQIVSFCFFFQSVTYFWFFVCNRCVHAIISSDSITFFPIYVKKENERISG